LFRRLNIPSLPKDDRDCCPDHRYYDLLELGRRGNEKVIGKMKQEGF
jgi:hypothetical protein